MVKKWDYTFEKNFLSSRGKVKNPRKQASSLRIDEDDLVSTPASRRKRSGRGNPYQTTRTGIRADMPGVTFRSKWESNFARVLNLYKIKFEFEPVEFKFPANKTGQIQSYLPDFYLPLTDEYLEVKGLLDSRGRSKLRRFKKHYPDEFKKLTVIISRSNKTNKTFFTKLGVTNILYYENIKDFCSEKIVNWE